MMKRVEQIDFARVLAMLSVILIHVTSTYIHNESKFMILDMNFAFILNQTARFSVPLFIMLSGISLSLSGISCGLRNFYKRKLLKIGIPYIFWFFIYFLYSHKSNLIAVTLCLLIKSFLLGQAMSHLYFIILIFQFYLLYPILSVFIKKSPLKSILISFIVSYLIQQLFFLRNFNVDLMPAFIKPYLWMLFPTWLFYFTVGAALTRNHLSLIQKFVSQHKILVLIVTIICSTFYVIESKATNDLDSIKTSLNTYTLFAALSAFALWEYLGKYQIMKKIINYLAKHSMTIYFNHVLVLCFFRRFSMFNQGMSGMFLLYVAVVTVATAFADIIDRFWFSLVKN